ncbi:MAG: hypothetical protein RL254_2226, partial [Planctomycetota bacterium]
RNVLLLRAEARVHGEVSAADFSKDHARKHCAREPNCSTERKGSLCAGRSKFDAGSGAAVSAATSIDACSGASAEVIALGRGDLFVDRSISLW